MAASMEELVMAAGKEVGGDVISAGGTGTYDLNSWATEIQAGSYALMDTAYAKLGLPFGQALSRPRDRRLGLPDWAVADCGLKALGMDHGNPADRRCRRLVLLGRTSDARAQARWLSGERVRVIASHVDPTVAYPPSTCISSTMTTSSRRWAVDLRGW